MIEAVLEHLSKDFFPDEPVFRSFIIVIFKIIILNTDHTKNHHHEYKSYNKLSLRIQIIQIVSQFLTRSVGVDLSNGSMMYEYKTSLEQGHSIAAVNSEGKILGVRIGVILHR